MGVWLEDVRAGARSLRRSATFSAIAILTLAAGIGAASAVFTVVNGVLLRPLPLERADELVRLWSNHPERGLEFFSVSPADYLDWQREARRFSGMAAFERQRSAVLGGAEPGELLAARATPELLPLLGAEPVLGRAFSHDDVRSRARVAVVTHAFWQTDLGGDTSAVGRTIALDDEPHTIIGVLPATIEVPFNPASVWTPLVLDTVVDRRARFLRVLGRLAPGATVADATAELRTLTQRLATEHPGSNAGWTITVRTVYSQLIGESFQRAIVLLGGVVGLVLLIAAANVANLLLARSIARQQELAVRAALGAARRRLIGQSLAETMLLAAASGLVGMLLATWCIDALRASSPAAVPRIGDIRVDAATLAFTGGLAGLLGVLLAIVPAWYALAPVTQTALRDGGRSVVVTRSTQRVRSTLVISQVTFALLLLAAAGLLLRSFWRLQSVPLGYAAEQVLAMRINLPEARFPDTAAVQSFYGDLLQRVRALPGVTATAAVSGAPMAGANSANVFVVEARAAEQLASPPDADYRVVRGPYFATLEIPLVRGRLFTEQDRRGDRVAIISENMAQRYWPDANAVGARLRFGDVEDGPWLTIVGVVGDARYQAIEGSAGVRPMIYLPHGDEAAMTIVARTAREPGALAASLRRAVFDAGPGVAPGAILPLEEFVAQTNAGRRFTLTLFGALAALALTLAVVGLYSTMSYVVTLRTRELGVRRALGAQIYDVVGLVLGQGLTLAGAGVVLGLVVTFAFRRVLRATLFDTQPLEPAVLAAVTALLVGAAALASALPAWRASRLDPVSALRE